jgi:hypothetical protein
MKNSMRLDAGRFAGRLLACAVGTFLAAGAMISAGAQTVYSVNIVGCVPDMTLQLLSAPMTIEQRQALHAQNFYQLPCYQRALYLHAVAFELGVMARTDGGLLSSAALAEYLKGASLTPANVEKSQALLAHETIVKEAMRELNQLIAVQVANNTVFQLAMESGAVYSFMWFDDWW